MSTERSRLATAARAVRARAVCVRLTRAFFALAAQLETLWTLPVLVDDVHADALTEHDRMQAKVDALSAMSATWMALALRGDVKDAAETLQVDLLRRIDPITERPFDDGSRFWLDDERESLPPFTPVGIRLNNLLIGSAGVPLGSQSQFALQGEDFDLYYSCASRIFTGESMLVLA